MLIKLLKTTLREMASEEKLRLKLEKQGVKIGKHVQISEDSEIGEYSYIGFYSRLDSTKVGRYTSIGDFCIIGPGEHRIKRISNSYALYRDKMGMEYYDGDDSKRKGGVTIGNDVWIGCNTVIRRGVTIGNGVVIGACSFVNKDVPDYAIVAGSPAQVIRFRFDKEKASMISNTKWWDEDLEGARRIISELE